MNTRKGALALSDSDSNKKAKIRGNLLVCDESSNYKTSE
jgi:hypothetical protein